MDDYFTHDIAFDVTVKVASHRNTARFALSLDPALYTSQVMCSHFATGLYEPEVSGLLVRALRPGDHFVDIGAHVGYFSLFSASLVGPEGRVFSFEPDPRNYAQLVQHARRNRFSQIQPFNLAVTAGTSDVTFYSNADNDGGHAVWDVGRHPFNQRSRAQPQPVQRPAVALDSFDPVRSSAARAVKIDTEGAEEEVLRGARSWLVEQQVPFIVAEVNTFGLEQMNSSQMSLRGFMGRLGYSTFMLEPDGGPPRLVRPDQVIAAPPQVGVFSVLFSTADAVGSIYPPGGATLKP